MLHHGFIIETERVSIAPVVQIDWFPGIQPIIKKTIIERHTCISSPAWRIAFDTTAIWAMYDDIQPSLCKTSSCHCLKTSLSEVLYKLDWQIMNPQVSRRSGTQPPCPVLTNPGFWACQSLQAGRAARCKHRGC